MVAIVSVCVADDVVLPWYLSFMDARCDLSAKIARCSGLIRRSLSPCGGTVSDGGWGMGDGDVEELEFCDGVVGLFCWG